MRFEQTEKNTSESNNSLHRIMDWFYRHLALFMA